MTQDYIKFDNKYIGDIIDRAKKITIRKGEPYVDVGDDVELLTCNGNKFGEAVIMWVKEEEAKEVVNRDFEHHQNYNGFLEFQDHMAEYYSEPIEPDSTFSVIAFHMKDE